jgi:hypothetical protein
VVDQVVQERIPQDVAVAHGSPEERRRLVDGAGLQSLDARHGIRVHLRERRCQLGDGARTLQAGKLRLEVELAIGDAVRDVAVELGQVPGQLAERAAFRVRAEVVLIFRQRGEQLLRLLALVLPRSEEPLELMAGHGMLLHG